MRWIPLVLLIACSSPRKREIDAAPLQPPGSGSRDPIPPSSGEPLKVPDQRFRHSSVRGDFRVYRTASGILVSWRTQLSARSLDGASMWRRDGLGRAVAVSPDGTRVVANDDTGRIEVLDAATGAAIGPAEHLGGGDSVWVSAFTWLPDNRHILAIDSHRVWLLRGDGTVDRELPICPGDCFLSAAVALSDAEAIFADSNGDLRRVNLPDGKVLGLEPKLQADDVDLSRDGSVVLAASFRGLSLRDAHNLAPRWQVPYPGNRGVQLASWQDMHTEEWKPIPKLSPNGKYVVMNDNAGRLWLLDAADGHSLHAFATELVNYVEDVMWLDDATLIAIDNAGHVLRITGTPARLEWSFDDAPEPERWDGP